MQGSMKFSSLTWVLTVFLLSVTALAADTEMSVNKSQVKVTVNNQTDAKMLFDSLGVNAITVDQGMVKRFSEKGSKDSLDIVCNLDHRNACKLTYDSKSLKEYFAKGDNSSIFFVSREVAQKLYEALNIRPTKAGNMLRKFFMTGDSRLEFDCYTGPAHVNQYCMFELIR